MIEKSVAHNGMISISCREVCTEIIRAEWEYSHDLNLGLFDRSATDFAARRNESDAQNRIDAAKRRAASCSGAIIVNGEFRCGPEIHESIVGIQTSMTEGSK